MCATGIVRVRERRFDEAASYFSKAVYRRPISAGHGTSLSRLRRAATQGTASRRLMRSLDPIATPAEMQTSRLVERMSAFGPDPC
jgi:hypothetical protein